MSQNKLVKGLGNDIRRVTAVWVAVWAPRRRLAVDDTTTLKLK